MKFDMTRFLRERRAANKPVPGIRKFICDECGHSFQLKTRDCLSLSKETCPNIVDPVGWKYPCGADLAPDSIEPHPEWPVDQSGNLL